MSGKKRRRRLFSFNKGAAGDFFQFNKGAAGDFF
jgi:hypothetical protein